MAQGIRYAADNGAKVLNMSIGRTGPAAPVVEDAIKYAVSKGAFVVIAAGNDFEDGNPTEVIAEIASRVQGAVSVAAVDRAKAHAYYSSSGSWVELAAPGGSFRGFGAEGGILQQTLDLSLVDTFLNAPAQYGRAALRRAGVLLLHRHVAGDAARVRARRDADAAGHHRTRRRSRRRSRSSRPTSAIRARRRCSATGSSRRGTRCADWGWRNEDDHRTAHLARAGGAAGRPDAGTHAASGDAPAVSFRPFVMVIGESFAAKNTFDATFGQSFEPFWGGGVQVALRDGIYVELSASRFKKNGQRAFRFNGQNFGLGIPLTATLTPIEFTAGYRFRLWQRRGSSRTPALGYGSYGYTETSGFADAGDNVDTRHGGYLMVGGVELRVHRLVGIGIDAQYTHVPGILGNGGISKDADENDLGGVAARVKVIIGR